MAKNFSNFFLTLTLGVLLLNFVLYFEEKYCYKQATIADPLFQKLIVVSEGDVAALIPYEVSVGQKVPVFTFIHLKCHQNFLLLPAVLDSLGG